MTGMVCMIRMNMMSKMIGMTRLISINSMNRNEMTGVTRLIGMTGMTCMIRMNRITT